jgi:hypothetical protein
MISNQRVGNGDSGEFLPAPFTKWPAASSKNDSLHIFAAARLQRLEHRTVFAVNRQDLGVSFLRQCHHQRPRHNQSFFVGQRYRLASFQRSPRPTQPHAADHRGHDDIEFRLANECLDTILSDQEL